MTLCLKLQMSWALIESPPIINCGNKFILNNPFYVNSNMLFKLHIVILEIFYAINFSETPCVCAKLQLFSLLETLRNSDQMFSS